MVIFGLMLCQQPPSGKWETLRRLQVTGYTSLGINICMGDGPSLLLLFLRETNAHTATFIPAQTAILERFCNLTIIHKSSMDMESLVHLGTSCFLVVLVLGNPKKSRTQVWWRLWVEEMSFPCKEVDQDWNLCDYMTEMKEKSRWFGKDAFKTIITCS